LIAISLTAGCASFSTMGKKQKLEDTLRGYEGAIRWNEFELANGFGSGANPPPDISRLSNIKVTSYQVRSSQVSEEKLEAKQAVIIQYYDINNMREETIVHNQQWTYDEGLKRWILQPSLPDF
jgi:hypothetical protein